MLNQTKEKFYFQERKGFFSRHPRFDKEDPETNAYDMFLSY